MLKLITFVLLFGLISSCGQRSKVTPMFKAISLSESHGDGKLAVFTVKIPLSENSIDAVDSPIDPRTGLRRVPIFGDVLRLIGQATFNMATQLGAGAQRIIISQPIPELGDEVIKHVSIKRVFFQIEQTDVLNNTRPSFIDRIRGLIRGTTKLDFDFIKELKINFRMAKTDEEPTSYLPDAIFNDMPEQFARELAIAAADTNPPFRLLNYTKKNRKNILNNSKLGAMFVIYTDHPVSMQRFIRSKSEFKEVILDTVKVGKSLVVELKGRQLETQKFFMLMEKYEAEVEELAIKKIDECNEDICMDLKINQENLLPMLMSGNALKIDTTMNLAKVPPKSFQLKGFIEFEIKIDSPL